MRISDWSSDVCSSDLIAAAVASTSWPSSSPVTRLLPTASADSISDRCEMLLSPGMAILPLSGAERSEEHTSELQSLMRISYAVFCLKKKKQNRKQIT